ncbi:MAG: AAA family ATPase [Chloroflexi bacterium]|nr:AAA family ATPase [Chloroflexota bacterium]
MRRVYLLTGKPGTGKTSLVRQVAEEARGLAGGFYTEEIRSGGVRLGFRLVTLDGEQAVLSHVEFDKRRRVGKYGVDIAALERVGVAALNAAAATRALVIVDEIGRMELLSDLFTETIFRLLAGGKPVLGTIMLDPHPAADAVKRHPAVKLIGLTRTNREAELAGVRSWLELVGIKLSGA